MPFSVSRRIWPAALLLLAALPARADQDDTFYRLQQGVNTQQQQREQQTVGDASLSFAASATAPETLMLALLQAINAQNADEIRRLLALYRQQPDHEADMVLFAEANLAIAANDMPQAIALYRQLYARNPQFARARLDLARLLFVDKQNREARALFEGLEVPGQPAVNQKIGQFVEALNQRDAWHGSLALGPVYASNLNQSSQRTVWRPQQQCQTDSNGVPLVGANGQLQCHTILLPATTPEAVNAKGLGYEWALNRQQSLHGHYALRLQAHGFGRWYRGHSEHNEHHLSVSPAYVYQNRQHSLSIGPAFQVAVAGKHVQHSSSGLQLNWGREIGRNGFASLYAERRHDRYRAEEHRHFNGPQTLVMLHGAAVLPNNWLLFGGYDYLDKRSREAVDSYRRHGLRLGVSKTWGQHLETTLQASLRRSSYRAEHAWLQTRRRDTTQTYQLDIKPARPLWQGFSPVLSLKHTRNRSSSWVNDYRSHEVMLKLNYAF